MNPNYEVLEQILRLDIDSGAATLDQRNAQKELQELAKRTKASEELLGKTRTDMAFLEGELRRQFKRVDELEERRTERSAKLFSAKNDDEHRVLKREVDNLERELRDTMRRSEDMESRIEQLKAILLKTETELQTAQAASADERRKAEEAESASSGRLAEINKVRQGHVDRLDDRMQQHYQRMAKLTRSPNGPITRVIQGACGNCHIGLAPQLLNNIARAKDVETCPSCHHILLSQTQASPG